MKPKIYSREDILNASIIGLEFEFYSKLQIKEVARSIAKETGKRVVIPYAIPPLGNQAKPLYHSPVQATSNIFKLEPDYSGGLEMFELITGPLPYAEAKDIIIKILGWIDKYGYTDDRCSIHINVSFDEKKIDTTTKIDKLNLLKFILSFDEKFVYDRFPDRKFSVYARSIQSIIPNSFFFYNSPPTDFQVTSHFNFPEEKYFGVNFTKRQKKYIEFRYLGGKNYEKKSKKIFECLDHFILALFNAINNPEYTEAEKNRIRKLYDQHRQIVILFNDYSSFQRAFPEFNITIDLKNDEQILKSFWEKIKFNIFHLIVVSGLKKGRFNYDTDLGLKQLAQTKLNRAVLRNYDLVECEIEGIISHCDLYDCEIKESRVSESKAIRGNRFENSKLQYVLLHPTNYLKNCYIENKNLLINCKVDGGIIRSGEIGSMAEISKETKIVETSTLSREENAPLKDKKNDSRPKDWRWIKSLKNIDKQ